MLTLSVKETGQVEHLRREVRHIKRMLNGGGNGARESQGTLFPDITARLSGLETTIRNIEALVQERNVERKQLKLLADVSQMINSSRGLTNVLSETMDRIVVLTGAERGFLMLRDDLGRLKVVVARNLDRESLENEELSYSKTIVNRVVASGKAILTTNAQHDPRFDGQNSIMQYNLRSILCVPLKRKDKITGAIYADNRIQSGIFVKQDLNILKAFGNQAAVAIENAKLFEKQQESHRKLQGAYESTLEGWARALEMRDQITEGHTRRVTEMTVRLARAMGFHDEEIDQIRRGALLHDIGKMAIPDRILLKQGPLDEDEWVIMRKHPGYAVNMVGSIEYLQSSLEIPYFHHEKWDGTGYPVGLAGEQIPLPARIFAVVDVWDALSSDRPYRQAWSREKVLAYLQDQKGKHFDPEVVDNFMRLFGQLES